MTPPRILVVGAGPAGLAAAIAAAGRGAAVTLLEQLPRPGAKLLATGGGRCNLTNTLDAESLARRFGRAWRFLMPALAGCGPEELVRWFAARGLPLTATDGFHRFPSSGGAPAVLKVLLDELERRRGALLTGRTVRTLDLAGGAVRGVVTDRETIAADRVIVTTGGRSYPELGARGAGYRLAAAAGHGVTPPLPALVGLRTRETWPGECAGIALPDAVCRIDLAREREAVCRGELLFTRQGISAFAVLDLSGRVSELLTENDAVPLRLNLFADRSAEDWRRKFDDWARGEGGRAVGALLRRELPARLVEQLFPRPEVRAAEFSAAQREEWIGLLTALPLRAVGTDGWRKAIVTRGGVELRGVAPATLESRCCRGLFFAGEVLDLDGPCGGYNLTWAFASGALAGAAAAESGETTGW